MDDEGMRLLQEAHTRDKRAKDKLLSTPSLLPTSPLITPPSDTSESREDYLKRFGLKAQDADHFRRFERYLLANNITKDYREEREDRRKNLFPDSDDDNDDDDDEEGEEAVVPDHNSNFDFDDYYESSHLVSRRYSDEIEVLGNSDSNYFYRKTGAYSSTNIERFESPERRTDLPTNSTETFTRWDGHSPMEQREIELQNNGIHNPHDPDYKLPAHNGYFALKKSPAEMFSDSLSLKFTSEHSFWGIMVPYRNNAIAHSANVDMLFVACAYGIEFIQPSTGVHLGDYRFQGMTIPAAEPTFVRHEDSYTPNVLKLGTLFGEEVLAAGLDDGRVLIWILDPKANKVLSDVPKYSLRFTASVWGLDMDPVHNLLLVSDNSCHVSLVVFNEDGCFLTSSQKLEHNIPSVCFLDSSRSGDSILVEAAAGSISHELVVLRFEIGCELVMKSKDRLPELSSGTWYHPLVSRTYAIEPAFGTSPKLFSPWTIARTRLSEDVWSVSHVRSSFFKKVISFATLTGNPRIWEERRCKAISQASRILGVECDPCVSSHFGIGATLAHFEICTREDSTENMMNTTDFYRRHRKFYDSFYVKTQRGQTTKPSANGKEYWCKRSIEESFDDNFVLVTTTHRVSLFRASRLVCNATSDAIFQYPDVDTQHMNRISMCVVIPEISAFVIANEFGQASLLRLTQYRGCFAFRQEYVFPGIPSTAVGLLGISVAPLDELRYALTMVNIDGKILRYEITNTETEDLLVEIM